MGLTGERIWAEGPVGRLLQTSQGEIAVAWHRTVMGRVESTCEKRLEENLTGLGDSLAGGKAEVLIEDD